MDWVLAIYCAMTDEKKRCGYGISVSATDTTFWGMFLAKTPRVGPENRKPGWQLLKMSGR